MRTLLPGKISAFAILALSLASCQKSEITLTENNEVIPSAAFKSNTNTPKGITYYALAGLTLDKYSTSNAETVLNSVTITGLQNGESILGLDFRPRTGQLYALGSNSRVYIIDPSNGMASFAFSFTSSVTGMPVMLSGTSFGFDFNPQVDRLRIISNTGQNLRVVPDNANDVAGKTFTDGSINPSPASVRAVAYDNNFDGTTSTKLYTLDAGSNLLNEVSPPNNGTLADPFMVNLKLEGDGSFDIAPGNMEVTANIGLAIFDINKKSTLFRINLDNGDTKIMAKYNKAVSYSSMAISAE